ncbi:MAG: hypothetical protein JWM80_4271 [Cyanobacteria bacterium RYN_339]|nr:hypothetical protein [Cyanobacteria bacterium RYN_339]
MDPRNDSHEETHLSRHLNRRRKRLKVLQVAFVLGLSLVVAGVIAVVLNPGVLDQVTPRSSTRADR